MAGTNGTSRMADPVKAAENEARLAKAKAITALAGQAMALAGDYKSGQYARTGGGRAVSSGPSRAFLNQRSRITQTARVQDLIRNNTLARMMSRRLMECTFGDGYSFQARSKNQGWNAMAEEYIQNEADKAKLWQVGQSCVSAGLSDGGILFVKLASGDLQAVEAQQIVSPIVKDRGDIGTIATLDNGNLCYDGVEVDKTTGRVVAFWIAEWKDVQTAKLNKPTNPGGVGQTPPVSGQWGVLADPTRVPAEECISMQWPLWTRPGQFRGEPGFQASVERFRLIDSYIDNVNVAAQMATLFGLVIKSDFPANMRAAMEATLGDVVGLANSVNSGEPKEIGLESGMVQYLKTGESIEQIKPELPTQNCRDFVMMNIQIIGSEIGLPMMLSVFDFQGLTASNAKVTQAIAWATTIGTLQHWGKEDLYRPWIRWKLSLAIKSGRLPFVEDWNTRHQITAPPAPVIDMATDVAAWLLAVNGNLTTKENATQQLGFGDFDGNAERRSNEIALEKKLDISPVLLPGAKPGTDAPAPEKKDAPAPTK